jgi:glutathionylspermidine synthase
MEKISITLNIIFMARKSKKAQERLDKVKFEAQAQLKRMQESAEKRAKELEQQIEEAEAAAKKALEEEEKLISSTIEEIEKLCKERGFFCGVIITKQILLQVVDMAIDNKGENIKIPFRLYIDDTDEDSKKGDTEQEPKKQE